MISSGNYPRHSNRGTNKTMWLIKTGLMLAGAYSLTVYGCERAKTYHNQQIKMIAHEQLYWTQRTEFGDIHCRIADKYGKICVNAKDHTQSVDTPELWARIKDNVSEPKFDPQ